MQIVNTKNCEYSTVLYFLLKMFLNALWHINHHLTGRNIEKCFVENMFLLFLKFENFEAKTSDKNVNDF